MYLIFVKLALNRGANIQALYPEDPKLPSDFAKVLDARITDLKVCEFYQKISQKSDYQLL